VKKSDTDGVQTGTWLNSDSGSLKGGDDLASNVTRISRAIKPASSDAIPQIVYYHYGVGMIRVIRVLDYLLTQGRESRWHR
jgi:uncharacterized protein (DUF2235 family)